MLTRDRRRQLGITVDQLQDSPDPIDPPSPVAFTFFGTMASSTPMPRYDGKPGLQFVNFRHDVERVFADKSANRPDGIFPQKARFELLPAMLTPRSKAENWFRKQRTSIVAAAAAGLTDVMDKASLR